MQVFIIFHVQSSERACRYISLSSINTADQVKLQYSESFTEEMPSRKRWNVISRMA